MFETIALYIIAFVFILICFFPLILLIIEAIGGAIIFSIRLLGYTLILIDKILGFIFYINTKFKEKFI